MHRLYNIYVLGIALVAGAVSCSKADESLGETESGEQQQITFSVTSPTPLDESGAELTASRVGVDGLSVSWEDGDDIIFYGSESIPGSESTYSIFSSKSIDGSTAHFIGELSNSITGKVSGFYPANDVYLNTGTNSAMYLSTLRLIQPTYLQFNYTSDSELTPSSVGKYSYMHVQSNESVESSSTLTGDMKHLMSFVEINLKNPKSAVDKVFISLSEALTYESMKVATDGTVTYDTGVDYIGNVDGTHATYKLSTKDFVIELYNSNGNLGVTANASNIIPLRLPLIPQPATWSFTLYVSYTDGSEDVITKTMNKTLEAGYFYNVGESIDLSGATSVSATNRTPKIGDYYYTDGTWSSVINESKTPEGFVYELTGEGTSTKVARIFNLYYHKLAFIDYDFLGANISTNFASISGNDSGLKDIAAHVTTAKSNYSSKLSGATTTEAVCEIAFPSISYALGLNASNPSSFSGDETGYWYLPSETELLTYILNVIKIQGHGVAYINAQMERLPASILGEWSGSEEAVGDVEYEYDGFGEVESSSYFGEYFNYAVTNSSTPHYCISTHSNGANYYIRLLNLHNLDPTSTNYISRGYGSNVTTDQIVRAIKRIN